MKITLSQYVDILLATLLTLLVGFFVVAGVVGFLALFHSIVFH